MFRYYTSSDISFAIGKFENVVGIFEGPGHRQVPHYKTKLGPSARLRSDSKMGEIDVEGAVEGKVSDVTVSDHLTVR